MILVLTLGKSVQSTRRQCQQCLLESSSEALLCYGTIVGFSIIVSEDILKKLFSDKKEALDKMDILNNVLALILFTAVGVTRVDNYKKG